MMQNLKELDPVEFATFFEPIVTLFGQNKFPQVRIAAYHDDLKHFSEEEVTELVEFILKNYFSPPTVSQLKRDAHAVFKKANERREKEINEMLGEKRCPYCDNSGIAVGIKVNAPLEAPYAFRCQCPAGVLKTDGMPKYTGLHAKQFKILRGDDSISTTTHSLKELPKLKSV